MDLLGTFELDDSLFGDRLDIIGCLGTEAIEDTIIPDYKQLAI